MNRKEAEFFELLVNYNQSKRPEEQQYYLEKMVSFKRCIRRHRAGQMQILFTWYFSAIRELIALLPTADEKQIADMVRPPLKNQKPTILWSCLNAWVDQKKIKKGFMKGPACADVEPCDRSAVIHNFQFITMQLAQSHASIPSRRTDISTVTLSCDRKAFNIFVSGGPHARRDH